MALDMIIDTLSKIRGKIILWKFRYLHKNISIGDGLKVYCRFDIEGKGTVSIGKNCVVRGLPGDKNRYVTLCTFSSEATISIGDNAMLVAARTSVKFEVRIGDDFYMEDATILDSDFHSINEDRGEFIESKEKNRVHIGDRVSVGSRSVICKGVTIGDDVLIYPGTIIVRNVPSGKSVYGNPARLLRLEQGVSG